MSSIPYNKAIAKSAYFANTLFCAVLLFLL